MPNKIKMLTLLQEKRGYAQITNRVPVPRPGVLFLMKLRARSAETTVPRRRLAITVDANHSTETPLPIKINHVNRAAQSFSVLAR
jgi:hypothetical protein